MMSEEALPNKNLRIDGTRLWRSLMEMAEIGATPKGGVCRLALSDLDKQGRDLFREWCEAAGCSVTVDPMGNMFARRPGLDPKRAPIQTGSHLDSQPTGGKFDGAYGVLAGLEVIRTLNDNGIETEAPFEVVVWTNEEGSRFAPAMIGSGVFSGTFSLEEGHGKQDKDGKTIGGELTRIGYLGTAPLGHPVGAYFEAHIEQGPILEADSKQIGIVSGVQGQIWYEITLTGQESHAGTTPMPVRRDALVGAAGLIEAVNRIGQAHNPGGCGTVGMLQVHPNSRNVIPGKVFLTVDFRHPSDQALALMDQEIRAESRAIADKHSLDLDLQKIWSFPALEFDRDCVAAVTRATTQCGYSNRAIVSGAGHDAVYLSKVAPTGMIFIPCADGISHNEIESATPEDAEAGCNVLLHAMLAMADRD
ncbi:Zn-dependent hydrolase [Limibacillus sp. MBR-115]|jgi:N-carbamoyl-L-amino-acid hydrolase|uniref:Zn-dependent hydrolase n=1 Tax=Limibacillus sp. MBR-115 TaxID=3156465 RepID=UPI0033913C6F